MKNNKNSELRDEKQERNFFRLLIGGGWFLTIFPLAAQFLGLGFENLAVRITYNILFIWLFVVNTHFFVKMERIYGKRIKELRKI